MIKTKPNLDEFHETETFCTTSRYTLVDLATNKGKRKNNEDAALAMMTRDNVIVLAVCDGLGGHMAGEEASHLVIDTLAKFFDADKKFIDMQQSMEDAIIEAHRQFDFVSDNRDTTLTLACIADGHAVVACVGDSRAQITRADGGVPLETIRQGFGWFVAHTVSTLKVKDIGWSHWECGPGTTLVLATDGLDTIHNLILAVSRNDAKQLCKTAINDHSTDNCTAIIAKF